MATRADKPKSFASRAQFRAWLERNHASVSELNLRLFKVHARERGVTYREALDEAPRAYEMFKHKEAECTKVVLKP